jgi:hypothetical protein
MSIERFIKSLNQRYPADKIKLIKFLNKFIEKTINTQNTDNLSKALSFSL